MRNRTYKPKLRTQIFKMTQSQIDSIRQDAKDAQELLNNPYLKSYCENTQKSILEMHAKQSIYDATETTENNGTKRTLKFPAKKEYTILAGQYRFIEKLFADLQQTVAIGKEMEDKINSEEIEIIEEHE